MAKRFGISNIKGLLVQIWLYTPTWWNSAAPAILGNQY